MEQESMDVSSFFEAGPLDLDQLHQLESCVCSSERVLHQLEAEVARIMDKTADQKENDRDLTLKVALSLQLLGRHREALEWFTPAREGKEKRYYAAWSLSAVGEYEAALTELDRAESRGWDPLEIELRRVDVMGRAGDFKDAEKALKRAGKTAQGSADWHYRQGELLERAGELEAALAAYERAVEADPDHSPANFRLGFLYDLYGEEELATERYLACVENPPVHVNALLNLAVIYEDNGRNEEAMDCLGRVLASHPNHPRARLYLKDVQSSLNMYYDEDQERRQDKRNQILETPITDFELSVRARNCLKKMNIDTLGDLLKISEAELLAYKNFGETSLNEIKVMLAQKGLQLGQSLDEPAKATTAVETAVAEEPPGHRDLLRKPVSELELSVRARKCLQRLNILTLGELIGRTESDLLGVKNFGLTSLNEIKQRLSAMGLSLRKPDR